MCLSGRYFSHRRVRTGIHLKTLDEVLRRLGEAGIRLKQAKCAFMKSSVEYLGHKISADGIRPTTEN